MKVKELKEILKDVPDDYEIISSGENSSYYKSNNVDIGMWLEKNEWFLYEDSFEDDCDNIIETKYKENAIMIW